jgi:hypothetical protein
MSTIGQALELEGLATGQGAPLIMVGSIAVGVITAEKRCTTGLLGKLQLLANAVTGVRVVKMRARTRLMNNIFFFTLRLTSFLSIFYVWWVNHHIIVL